MAICGLGDLFRVFTRPERRAVMMELARGKTALADLATQLNLATDQTEQHVEELVRCGLVTVVAKKPVMYGLGPEVDVSQESGRTRITVKTTDGQEFSFASPGNLPPEEPLKAS